MPADFDSSAQTRSAATARPRVPEPMVMHAPQAATAFDQAGQGDGPLVPLYELCARGMHKLLPAGGAVLDLGSGSGRFLAYLAARRGDLRITGVELSAAMLELGKRMLAADRLTERVQLRQGDMTACSALAPPSLDLLSCMLALHQLPSADELLATLREVARIRERTGCAILLADIVRLDDDGPMKQWMAQTPDADPLFWEDALASEAAGWTQVELEDALVQAGLDDLRHAAAPLLQIHWARARKGRRASSEPDWLELAISRQQRGAVLALRMALRDLP